MSAAPNRERIYREMADANELAFRGLARQLRRNGRSPKTTVAYHAACLSLEDYLTASGAPSALLLDATAGDVTDWMIELREHGGWRAPRGGAPAQRGTGLAKDSVASYFASLRRFYNWARDEGLIDESPMARMAAPPPSGKPVPLPDLGLVKAMIAGTSPGKKGSRRGPLDVRDELIIRLFCETGGPRCSEVAYLPAGALDLRRDTVTITGKGDRRRVIALSASTAMAAQRWVTLRARHPAARLPWLLLGVHGGLSPNGVYKVIRTRAEKAGGTLYPHQLRHLAADRAKAAEMPDGDIMTLFGWTSPQMLARYGKARAEARALESSRRHALGDQL